MIRSVTLCLLMIGIYTSLYAQVDSAYRYRRVGVLPFSQAVSQAIEHAVLDVTDTAEGGKLNRLERWQLFMNSRVSNDVPLNNDVAIPLNEAMVDYMKNLSGYCSPAGFTGEWQCLGPFTSQQQQGRVNAIWVHPSDTNIILVGADGGGLWKSTNAGQTWRNITDNAIYSNNQMPAMLGVNNIAVNPLDIDNIYITLGISSQYYKSVGYSVGVAFTTDGGVTWEMDFDLASVAGAGNTPEVRKIMFVPGTDTMFAITNRKVLFKAGTSASWVDTTPVSLNNHEYDLLDLEIDKYSNNDLIVSTSSWQNASKLCKYNLGSDTWTTFNIALPGAYYQLDNLDGIKFVSSNNITDSLYLVFYGRNVSDTDSVQTSVIMRSKSNAINLQLLYEDTAVFQRDIIQDFIVSPSNPDVIYIPAYGVECFFESTDGGFTFASICNSHADGRCIFLHASTYSPGGDVPSNINDVFYLGTDGGILRKEQEVVMKLTSLVIVYVLPNFMVSEILKLMCGSF